jgi:hypothetical protein
MLAGMIRKVIVATIMRGTPGFSIGNETVCHLWLGKGGDA